VRILDKGTKLAALCLLSAMLAFASFALAYNFSDVRRAQPVPIAALKTVSQSLWQADIGYASAGPVASPPSESLSSGIARSVRVVVMPPPLARPTAVPVPSQLPPKAASSTESPELLEFSRRVVNGQPGSLCGLYVAGILALRVVQQPADDPAYISQEDGTATEFQKADLFDAVGLLAHNTLAGRDFFKLSEGRELILIYGDGRVKYFHVSEVADFQRLTLADLRSDFLPLDSNQKQTADQVFARFYQQAHRLTLQTCLRRGDIADWGVHFVVADPNPAGP
jgi:hypothetical protein